MPIDRQERTGRSIFPDDRAAQDEFDFTSDRLPARLVSIWGSKIFMVLVFAAGAMGLTYFASVMSKKDQNLADGDQGGAGIIVRLELLHIWLPPALIELVEREPSSGAIRTHEELKRFLDHLGRQNLWYALTARGHQANGELVDLPFVRQPYKEHVLFPEFLKILAMAAENSTDEFSSASVHVLTEEIARCEIRDVMAELKRNPYSLVGLDRRGDSGDR
jgi:hypothetical protein